MNTEDKFYFGNIGTKAESELTVRITKMLGEVERAVLSRNQEKAKSIASKVREMIRKSANTSTAKMQMDELNSIMLGVSFSRTGRADRFGMAEQVMRDGSVHLDFSAARDYLAKQSVAGLRYIVKDAKAARDAMGTEGKINKFNYYTDLVLEAQRELKKRGFSRPGQPERFAREVIARKGNKRVELSGPMADGRWTVTVMEENKQVVPGEVHERFVESKFYSTEAGARRAASKMLASRPGQPERFERMVMTSKGNYRTSLGRDTRVQIEGGKGWLTVDPAQYITPQRVRVQGIKREIEVRAVVDGKEIVGVSAKLVASRPNKPETFASKKTTAGALRKQLKADGFTDPSDWEWHGIAKSDSDSTPYWLHEDGSMEKIRSSRPGQPERFAKISDIKIGTGRNEDERNFSATIDGNEVRGVLYKGWSRIGGAGWTASIEGMAKSPGWRMFSSMRDAIAYAAERLKYSRPGQPERFDASSLNRGNFAEASSSPMLGKLLSEKQMPEGGWRAVETGGGALVISFEDGDVAGNFARRVAGSGYSATAPVQSIGRYWNVEVKNGK